MARRGHIVAILMTSLLVTAPSQAAGPPAEPAGIAVGDRVRIRNALRGAVVGNVLETRPGALLIKTADRFPMEVPIGALTRVDVAVGTRSLAPEGAAIGFLAGAAFLTGFGLAVCRGGCDGYWGPFALSSAGSGALVGAVGGAMLRTDRWVPAGARRVAVTVVPQRRGAAVGVAVRLGR
jgi:hypothetical protein